MVKNNAASNYSILLKECLNAIESIESFLQWLDYQAFQEDDKSCSAVLHKLSVLSEAAAQISDDFKGIYPQVPWKEIAEMREKSYQVYYGVDYPLVWEKVMEWLPSVKMQITRILQNIDTDQLKTTE